MNNDPIENPNQTQSASNDPSFVEQVLDSIGDHAIDAAFDTVVDKISSIAKPAIDVAGSAANTAIDAAGSAANTVIDVAGSVAEKAIDAAGPAIDQAIDAAGEVAGGIIGGFLDGL